MLLWTAASNADSVLLKSICETSALVGAVVAELASTPFALLGDPGRVIATIATPIARVIVSVAATLTFRERRVDPLDE
jgi:hypothetical protein